MVGYDDDQGPLLARVYFLDTGIFELHDNSYIRYQSLNAALEKREDKSPTTTPVLKDVSEYKYLVGTRHVDSESGLTYETTEIKVAPNKDILAWRKGSTMGSWIKTLRDRFTLRKLDKNLYT